MMKHTKSPMILLLSFLLSWQVVAQSSSEPVSEGAEPVADENIEEDIFAIWKPPVESEHFSHLRRVSKNGQLAIIAKNADLIEGSSPIPGAEYVSFIPPAIYDPHGDLISPAYESSDPGVFTIDAHTGEINSVTGSVGQRARLIVRRAGNEDYAPVMASRMITIIPNPFSRGSGREGDPYQIATIDQFNNIRDNSTESGGNNYLDDHFVLKNDLDFEGYVYDDPVKGWLPIGNQSAPFTGSFNGKGFVIKNLLINRPEEEFIGLFGKIETSGNINLLGIENANISGKSSVGGITGWNTGSITHSYSTGHVTGNEQIGGLTGNNYEGNISACYASGQVTGNNKVGGLVGDDGSQGTVTDSYWNTDTSGQSGSAGGEGLTTEEMHMQSSFLNWDFRDTWIPPTDEDFPLLRGVGTGPGDQLTVIAGLFSDITTTGASFTIVPSHPGTAHYAAAPAGEEAPVTLEDIQNFPGSGSMAVENAGNDVEVGLTGLLHGAKYVVYVILSGSNGSVSDITQSEELKTNHIVNIEAVHASSSEANDATASFTITRTGQDFSTPLTVNVLIEETGMFISGDVPAAVTFGTNNTTTRLSVPIEDDRTDEPDGTITATIANGSGYSAGADASAVVSVTDNDLPGVTITTNTPAINEGGTATFTLTRTGVITDPLTVAIAVSEGAENFLTGTPPSSVTFSPNEPAVSFEVSTEDDGADEADGSITATIQAGDDYTISDLNASATVTVRDDDQPVISFEVTNYGEVSEDIGSISFTLTREGLLSEALDVNVNVTETGTFITGDLPDRIGFKANEATAIFEVFVEDDEIDEPDGTITADIRAGDDYTISDLNSSTVITVQDDDKPVISITSQNEVTEGSDRVAVFTLTREGLLSEALDVHVNVTETGTFITGDLPDRIGFKANEAITTLEVFIEDDEIDEPDGTITATIQAGSGYTLGSNTSASVNVIDGDLPVITIAAPEPALITEGDDAIYTLTREGVITAPLTVTISVDDGGRGFLPGASSLEARFSSGNRETMIRVRTSNDTDDEPDGTITATITDGSEYSVGANASAMVSVTDNDLPGVTITINTFSISEGGTATFILSRTGVITAPLTVAITVNEGTGNFLFGTPPSSVTFLPDQPVVNFEISTEDDNADEPDGTITATIQAGSGHALGSNTSASVNVIDDDLPVITIAAPGSALITEGNDAVYTLTREGVITAPLTVAMAVDEGTGNFLFGTPPSSVTFPPDQPAVSFEVSTEDDNADEPDGTITATITNGSGYLVGANASAMVSVTDDDLPEVTILATPSAINEGETATFMLTRTEGEEFSRALTVTIEVIITGDLVDASLAGTKTVEFEANDRTSTFTLLTNPDSDDEDDGSITASITGGGATYSIGGASSASVSVIDNDLPTITITAATPRVVEGVPAAFTLTRLGSVTSVLTVDPAINESGSFITGGLPASVRFDAGMPTATLTVNTSNDSNDEMNGTITVAIRPGPGYTFGSNTDATVNVIDNDDPMITIMPGVSPVSEGTNALFTLSRTEGEELSQTLTVNVQVTDESGGFITGSRPSSVIFDAGMSAATLAINTSDDTDDETNGTITVTIANGSEYLFDNNNADATVDVTDDDLPLITMLPADPALVQEGGDAVFMLTRSEGEELSLTLTVDILVTDESGSFATGDLPSFVVFDAGMSATMFSISTFDDMNDERNGTITAVIQTRGHYRIGTKAPAIVDIQDNDRPIVSIMASGDVTEGADGSAVFTLRRDGLLSEALDVNVNVTETGTFIMGGLPEDRVRFEVGKATARLEVLVEDDGVDEPDGTITADIQAGSGHTLGSNTSASVNVIDDDLPVITIAAPGYALIIEGDDAVYTLTREGVITAPLTVAMAVSEGTGNFLSETPPSSVTFPPDQPVVNFEVSTEDDNADEPDGTITATIQAGSGHTLGSNTSASVNVIDDDLPVITIAAPEPALITEGDDVVYTLTREGVITAPLTVTISVDDGGRGFLLGSSSLEARFSSGNREAMIRVRTSNDTDDEPDGTITATITDGSEYSVGANASAMVSVTDNDLPGVTITINTFSISEGGTATFILSRTGVITAPLTVAITVNEGTGNFLFGTPPSSVTFLPDQPVVNFEVSTEDDNADEPDGTITATIQAADNYTISGLNASAVITVRDDDQSVISFEAANYGAVSEDVGSVSFILRREGLLSEALDVNVNVTETGTFIRGGLPDHVRFEAGEAAARLEIFIEDDEIDEIDGTITAAIQAGDDYISGLNSSAVITVQDDDQPLVAFETTDYGAVSEDVGSVSFILRRDGLLSEALDVNVNVTETGTFIRGGLSDHVRFEAGEAAARFEVLVEDDEIDEPDGTITADIQVGDGYVSGLNASAVITVRDDDKSVISFEATNYGAVSEDIGVVSFILRRDGLLSEALDVNVNVTETGTFIRSGLPGRVRFKANEATAIFEIFVENDEIDESDGTITATIQAGDDYMPGLNASATITVRDDDQPVVAFETTDYGAVSEDIGVVSFILRRDGLLSEALDVNVNVTETGMFIMGNVSNAVTFEPNEATTTLNIRIEDDDTGEPGGMITAAIQAGDDYISGLNASATITVRDDDQPVVAFETTDYGAVSEDIGSVSFTLTREGLLSEALDVHVNVTETGTFISGDLRDGIKFKANEATATLEVLVEDDEVDEPDGTITATIQAADNYTISDLNSSAMITVRDDDQPVVAFETTDYGAVSEDIGSVSFTLTREGLLSEALDVNVNVTETGMFIMGNVSNAVTFEPNEATTTLNIRIEDDDTGEPDGTITATIQAADNYTISDLNSSAMITVRDDDQPVVAFETTDYGAVSEDIGSVSFTLTREGLLSEALDVHVNVTETETFIGVGLPDHVRFEAGEATATLEILVEDDEVDKPDGTITATIQAADNYTISDLNSSAMITVRDNDKSVVTISVALKDTDIRGEDDDTMTTAFTLTRVGDITVTLTTHVLVTHQWGAASDPSTVEEQKEIVFAANDPEAILTVNAAEDTQENEITITAEILSDDTYPYITGTPRSAQTILKIDKSITGFLESGGTSMFPNPVGDVLYVHLPKDGGLYTLNVYTLSGQRILSYPVPAGDKRAFNISSISEGIYIAELIDKNEKSRRYRIIKGGD